MMGILNGLFGPKTDFKALVKNGAVIIDVRTPSEFKGGHIPNSINIPVDQFHRISKKLKLIKSRLSPAVLPE